MRLKESDNIGLSSMNIFLLSARVYRIKTLEFIIQIGTYGFSYETSKTYCTCTNDDRKWTFRKPGDVSDILNLLTAWRFHDYHSRSLVNTWRLLFITHIAVGVEITRDYFRRRFFDSRNLDTHEHRPALMGPRSLRPRTVRRQWQ